MTVITLEPRSRKTEPHDLELEKQALCSGILSPGFVLESDLKPEHFYSDANGRIWSALVHMAAEGDPIDTVELAARLSEANTLQRVGGIDYLLDLTDAGIPGNVNVRRLRLLAQQRRGLNAALLLQRAIAENDGLPRAFERVDEARAAIAEVERGASKWHRMSAVEIFAPLPPVPWLVEGLQLCPGRPGMLAGYGSSGKTVAVQSLALAIASGTRAWCQFSTSCAGGRVLHIDYEQGQRATSRRYQRLAIGHGIDPRAVHGRLELMALPRFYLDAADAYGTIAREAEGAALVIIDSLRAATPNTDENDSRIRVALDNLTRASEATGAAFLVIHHDGKPKEGHSDQRTTLRGSSSIFDACGCVLGISPGKTKGDARPVHQKKPPAEAEGAGIDRFELAFVDVATGLSPTAGLRVEWREQETRDPVAENREKLDANIERLLRVIREKPGSSQTVVIAEAGMKEVTAKSALAVMTERGLVRVVDGPRKASCFYLETA